MSVDRRASAPTTPPPSTSAQPANRVDLAGVAEDHALERVPDEERRSGLGLLWNTAGVGSTLVVLTVGVAVTSIAGVGWGIAVGGATAVFGGLLGWAVGHVSYVAGVSSTVATRYYGLGTRGSALASLIFAFMIIGFLAAENQLLYNGTLFVLGWQPSLGNAVLIYGALTVLWLLLPAFGLRLVQRTSGLLTAVTAVLFVVVAVIAVQTSGTGVGAVLGTGPLVPDVGGQADRVALSFSIIAGIAGALALVGADFARYARTSRDVAIMAVGGSVMVNLLVLVIGTVIVQAGSTAITKVLAEDPARAAGVPGADTATKLDYLVNTNFGAYFFVLATGIGFALVYAAQAKAQVINAYSGSLSLTNLVDSVFRRSPGRVVMLVVANLIGLVLVSADLLGLFNAWLEALGILTTSLATLVVVDYFWVRGRRPADPARAETVNWAGVSTLIGASAAAEVLSLTGVTKLGFIVAMVATAVGYPILRRLLPERVPTTS